MKIDVGDYVKSRSIKIPRGEGYYYTSSLVTEKDSIEIGGEEREFIEVVNSEGLTTIWSESIFFKE